MRRATLLTSIAITLAGFHGSGVADAKNGSQQQKNVAREEKERLLIRVAPGDWGNANPAEIEALLNSVGNQMLIHFPGKRISPIVVAPSANGPLVMYQKGPSNEYQVLLAAKDRRWAEYVYEFSHELLHILAGYDLRSPSRTARHQWFEEMLCETASLYMLKRYALMWNVLAPRPEWTDYTPEMQRFANRALSEKHRHLPRNITFDEWFQKNGPGLATKPYLREKNDLVAMMFLPLLERTPDWRAIEYLNVGNYAGELTLHDHLARWYRNTPMSQRPLVTSTFGVFRYNLPADHAVPRTDDVHTITLRDSFLGDAGPAGRRGR